MANISAREAFKLGFLQRCADEGLDASATQQRIEKVAALLKQANYGDALKKLVSDYYHMDQPSMMATGTIGLGLAGAVATPVVGGWALGRLARYLKGDHLTPEDVHKQELINQYRNLAKEPTK